MNTDYTLGALLVGVIALLAELAYWYPGHRTLAKKPLDHATALAPFAWTWCVGALTVLAAGGLVGWAMDWYVWGAGWLGDAAYVWGVGGQREAAPQAVSQPLTSGGLFMLVCVLVVAWIRIKRNTDKVSASQKRGLVSGSLMALSAGVAATVAVPLASAANLSGAWITGTIS